ncbi:MAG: TlpA family protein disulfide reductase [Spirochaetales bacterium]|nr:TlpA family protein disulfide reductase [Spirochaetales bacterium]
MSRMVMLVITSVMLMGLAGCKPPEGVAPTAESREEPLKASLDVTMASLSEPGGELRLADYKGQVVLLDFWATWCPPCRAELPHLKRLHQDLNARGFTLIGMTVDRGSRDEVAEAVARFKINYPLGLADEAIQKRFGGIRAVPTKFLLDKKGAIRQSYVGYVSEAQLRNDIAPLLAE